MLHQHRIQHKTRYKSLDKVRQNVKQFTKEKAKYFLKLLFIKVRCLINVTKICGFLENG